MLRGNYVFTIYEALLCHFLYPYKALTKKAMNMKIIVQMWRYSWERGGLFITHCTQVEHYSVFRVSPIVFLSFYNYFS